MDGTQTDVRVVRDEHLMTVRINRPQRKNALDVRSQVEIVRALEEAGADPEIRAVVIRGTGDMFCAGRDLKELRDLAAEGRRMERPMTGVYRNLYEAVLETPKPTIAAVNGPAVGGGCELAMACDLRIAAESAWFQLPEAIRGMGAHASSVLAHRILPRALAFEMLYLAKRVDAQLALDWHLVNAVHPDDKLDAAVADVVAQIVAKAPLSMRRFKEMAMKSDGLPVAAAFRLNMGLDPYLSEDREEGVRAFTEGRPPAWQAR